MVDIKGYFIVLTEFIILYCRIFVGVLMEWQTRDHKKISDFNIILFLIIRMISPCFLVSYSMMNHVMSLYTFIIT